MPLVRVSGSDAASFDTFDVAEMTDGRDQHSQRNWSSRQSGSGAGVSPANSRHAKHASSSTPDTDDDSSSGRRSEEVDRVGSISSRGITSMRGHSQSSISLGSSNSYFTGNSSNYDASSYPLYETVDNLDEAEQDPRNPFNKSHNPMRSSFGENIPEEDETSFSSLDDSSVTPSVQQQQSNQYQNPHSRLPNSQQMHQPAQHRSHRHRQKQQPSSISEQDDVSVTSHQSSRQDFNNRKSSHIISQLESQVMKVNFELATTKSSLDELQLENRRLNDDKDKLNTNITLLQEENDQLHLKIERMERETILRNIEGTKGAVRSVMDHWGGGTSVSGNTCARDTPLSNRAYVPVTKQKLGKAGGGLEVPFRTSETDYHLRPRRSSLCSVTSFNDLSSDGDVLSRGDNDCQSLGQSAHSITLSENSGNLGSPQASGTEELEETTQKGRISILANMIGGGKRPSVREISKQIREITKQTEEATISSPSRRNRKTDEEDDIPSQSLPSKEQDSHLETDESDENDDDIGSNPQGEDFNDDDPFATWSVAGDPMRKRPEQNWLQRGLGRGRDNSRQPPQSKEIIEDPFDTCKEGSDEDNDDSEKYTSFSEIADNAGDRPGSNNNDGESAAAMQERRRFGLFRLGGRR